MQILQYQYTNLCELLKFKQSKEFKKLQKKSNLHIIEISSFIDNAALMYSLVNDLHTVFPKVKISSNYVNNIKKTDISLIFYFSVSIENKDDQFELGKSELDLQRCQTKELQILYNQLKEKNELIELFNRQIIDSLIYASKLQKAIIPRKEYFSEVLPQHFVIYKPKHIVSGDFFWLHEQGDKIYIAVADCTGHGMPGALMSILGITCLNEISNMFNNNSTISASQILDLLRDKIKQTLHQKGEIDEMKDGLDIGLCIIDKETLKLQFAGAYIPILDYKYPEPLTLQV